mmetsp:Transcript_3417/g.6107  ORF Transcript_3417/g.6107 Transcript_3417/m.6107 type:complete len:665 (-) Transcript_3417:216-2210(-)
MAPSTYRYLFLGFALGSAAASSLCQHEDGLMSDTCSDEAALFLQKPPGKKGVDKGAAWKKGVSMMFQRAEEEAVEEAVEADALEDEAAGEEAVEEALLEDEAAEEEAVQAAVEAEPAGEEEEAEEEPADDKDDGVEKQEDDEGPKEALRARVKHIIQDKFDASYKVESLLSIVDRVQEELDGLDPDETLEEVYGAGIGLPPNPKQANLEDSDDAPSEFEEEVDQILFGTFKPKDTIESVGLAFDKVRAFLEDFDPEDTLHGEIGALTLMQMTEQTDADLKAKTFLQKVQSVTGEGAQDARALLIASFNQFYKKHLDIPGSMDNQSVMSQCCRIATQHGLIPLSSWGSTPSNERLWWGQNNCDKEVGGGLKPNCKVATPVEEAASNTFANGLVVLMRAGGPHSGSRLTAVNQTWARGFIQGPQSKVVTFLDNPEAAQECRSAYGDNHAFGLTCLEAKNELSLLNRTDFKWVLIIDDDAYAHIPNLEKLVGRLDPYTRAVYGIPGCGHCTRNRHGLCGGGGYIISRVNLEDLADQEDLFLDEFLHGPDQDWCDVRFGCVAQRHGMSIQRVPGLYAWKLNATQDFFYGRSSEVPPLVFHYSEGARMYNLHAMFAEMDSNDSFDGRISSLMQVSKNADVRENASMTLSWYWSQQEEYIKVENARRIRK